MAWTRRLKQQRLYTNGCGRVSDLTAGQPRRCWARSGAAFWYCAVLTIPPGGCSWGKGAAICWQAQHRGLPAAVMQSHREHNRVGWRGEHVDGGWGRPPFADGGWGEYHLRDNRRVSVTPKLQLQVRRASAGGEGIVGAHEEKRNMQVPRQVLVATAAVFRWCGRLTSFCFFNERSGMMFTTIHGKVALQGDPRTLLVGGAVS